MTTLVTGPGFLGGYVVRDLVADGDRVVCMSRAPSLDFLATILPAGSLVEVELLQGDIADLPRLLHIVRARGIDRIVHLAGLLYLPSEANPPLAERVHVQGTMNVFEAAALLGVEKVVWSSSVSVYGARSRAADGFIGDDSPLDPGSVYGSCKAFCERLAVAYAERYGLDITGLRLSAMYGHGKQLTVARGSALTWLDQLIDRPARGEGPCVVPSGDGSLDFQYVEDASRAVMLALAAQTPGGETFLTSGDFRPIRDAFAYVRSLLPAADMTLEPGGAILPAQSGPYRADAVREALGFTPRFSMEAGILQSIQTIRELEGLPPVVAPPTQGREEERV